MMELKKDQDPGRRFVDGVSYDVLEEEVAQILERLGFSSMEEFKDYADRIEECEYRQDGTKVKKESEEEQPLEEWAEEHMCKDLVKADIPLFVRALMSVKHWVFDTLSPEQSEGIYTKLVNRMLQDKWSLSDLVREVQSTDAEISETQAKAIARSESTLIVNKSREMTFARNAPGEYGYSWGGPSDRRTTVICSNIKARIPKNGVDTLDELKEIVREEAQKYYDANGYKTTVREWLPHPNCRHYIRSIWRG